MRQLHQLSGAREILTVSGVVGARSRLLTESAGKRVVRAAIQRFQPARLAGHLAIEHDCAVVPIEPIEFSFHSILGDRPAYVFFDQEGVDRNNVVAIAHGSELSRILQSAFGMEYFLTDKQASYLISANWHSVQAAGAMRQALAVLEDIPQSRE